MKGKKVNNKDVILFDGICLLCNAFVKFVLKFDAQEKFIFSPLQSNYSKNVLNILEYSDIKNKTVVIVRNGKKYKKSTAVLMILTSLPHFFKLFYVFYLIPKFIRDKIYELIANNRYRIFGKKDSCMIPPVEERERFLE